DGLLAPAKAVDRWINRNVGEWWLQDTATRESTIAESMIPIYGPWRDAVHDFANDNYWGGAFNLGMMALDVATLGTSSLARGLILKGGGRVLGKVGLKVSGRALLRAAEKHAAREVVKKCLTGAGLPKIAKRAMPVVNFLLGRACFAAGTPLLTPDGSKPIEQFRPGDLVLSRSEFDPEGPVEPKVVEEVFERWSKLLYVTVGEIEIGTTAEHPFYVRGKGWTAAEVLKAGD